MTEKTVKSRIFRIDTIYKIMIVQDKSKMQKFLLTSILLLFIIVALPAQSLMSLSSDVIADEVALEWEAVEGALFYDIYNEEAFITRLDASILSYTLSLGQKEAYSLIIGARDLANNTLAAAKSSGVTGSYEGTYTWINNTDNDNHGKVKSLVMRAELATSQRYGEYMKIYSVKEDGTEELFFPLFDLESSSWPWVEYDSNETTAEVYRDTAARFNTSTIKPSRFRLERISLEKNKVSLDIRTRAFGIEVITTTIFEFGHDEEGLFLKYSTTGSGVAKSAIFKNPEGGDDPYTFILRLQENEKLS